MNDIDIYLKKITEEDRCLKLLQVINYMRKNYKDLLESCDYGPKTKFPTFKNYDESNYFSIANQKNYISLHFGRYHCVEEIAKVDSRIKTGVGCVKIPDSVTFPIVEIKKGISNCFNE
ncbi:MAG: hypothetical protein ACK5LM_07105 [Lactovum sp.]